MIGAAGTRALLAALLALLAGCATAPPAANDNPYVIYRVAGNYTDVLDDVKQSIIGRGMVIGAVSHVVEMLERTGKDLGLDQPIYGNGEVQLFCSAVLSRQAMESDTRNIIYCPYGIAVWTEIARPGQVFVGFRRADLRGTAASNASLVAIEKLLDEIAREATRR